MGKKSRPNAFQGNLKKRFYFEGWYNKIVDESANHIYAIIPTIALNRKNLTSHCAIQFFDAVNATSEYFQFPLDEFKNLSNQEYEISIEKNFFSSKRIILNIDQQGYKIKGDLKYFNSVPWPSKFLQPGAMGFLSYLPFLETYHSVVSMNHRIEGEILVNGEIINFNYGKGYIEKDWGKSFPVAWIWAQSNHFSNEDLSFMFSIAKVPFLGKKFNGFLSAIWDKGKFYKFATYTGAKVRSLTVNPDSVHISIEDQRYRVSIEMIKKGIKTRSLLAPQKGTMSGHISETINSKIILKLFDLKTQKIIIDDEGVNAGFEAKEPETLKPKKQH
ncbi:MAG: tocopherol cyclase family protein [Candidatus Thorarchaeota archaeon]